MMQNTIFVALTLICAAALPALANDTTAELATAGLIFVTNDNIEMSTEDLFISAKQVRVRYRLVNKANTDVTVLVAFPLPEVRISEPDQNIALPTEDPVNIFAFTTRVNGKPISMQVEQRVTAVGIDRTQYLRNLGIPFAPQLQSTRTRRSIACRRTNGTNCCGWDSPRSRSTTWARECRSTSPRAGA